MMNEAYEISDVVPGQMVPGLRPATPPDILTAESILDKVRRFQEDNAELFARMDSDQDLYELKPYNANRDGTTTFPSYTSNAPRTYANKVISLLISGELSLHVPYGNAHKDERDAYDLKERFGYGLLHQADDRLKRRLEQAVKTQFAQQATVRSYICVRGVFGKDKRGQTYVDILPLDPRNAAWGVGYAGLAWAAYTTQQAAEDIEARYGISLGSSPRTMHDVTDFYDQTFNAVVVKGHGFVKPPTPHGAHEVPVYIVPVGPTTLGQASGVGKAAGGYGESIFAANRDVYKQNNNLLSIYLSLVQKARDRSYVLYSADGTVQLEDNPNEAAGVIPLPSSAKLDLVGLAETTKDAAILAGAVNEEMHFGSLSKPTYGDIPFQLSGFAINSLRQSVFGVLRPILDAMQTAYELVLNGLCDQYVTGAFANLTVAGYGNDRAYFDQAIRPEAIRNLPPIEVKLEAQLPQDDASRISMAQAARTGPNDVPLLPDVDILDRIVGVRDVGATQAAINEQLAERVVPRAFLYTLLKGAQDRGRDDLAPILMGELIVQQLQQLVALATAQMQAAAVGAAPNGDGKAGGFGPEVLPNAARGKSPPLPTPQAGPNVPPGTERPGAQQSFLARVFRRAVGE